MNKDIELMIKLQRYWDNILRIRDDIEKSKKSIVHWNNEIKKKDSDVANLSNELKRCKNMFKQMEIDLTEMDEHSRRLEERKLLLKTEKELKALDNELTKVNSQRSELEDKLILLIDEQEERQEKLAALEADLDESRKQANDDIKMLNERIERNEGVASENKEQLDHILPDMSEKIRARFQKLLGSGDGKAIVEIEDDICGGCRFRIPASMILEASDGKNIVNCSNCGRFIYKS